MEQTTTTEASAPTPKRNWLGILAYLLFLAGYYAILYGIVRSIYWFNDADHVGIAFGIWAALVGLWLVLNRSWSFGDIMDGILNGLFFLMFSPLGLWVLMSAPFMVYWEETGPRAPKLWNAMRSDVLRTWNNHRRKVRRKAERKREIKERMDTTKAEYREKMEVLEREKSSIR